VNPLFDTRGAPPGTRAIGDVDATRSAIYDQVLDAVRSYTPATNTKYTLSLEEPAYESPDTFALADEKRAIIEGRSLERRLRGTWRLRTNDEQQQLIDEKRTTLAMVPHMTRRGTFILNGNEYALNNQMRLRPGIFTRVKDSGVTEAHVNVARGFGHRYTLDPETGVFRAQFGQAQLPLMPILRALGVPDSAVRNAWGNEIYEANAKKIDPKAIKTLYSKIKRGVPAGNEEEMNEAIRKAFADMELDPEVMARTLGIATSKMHPGIVLSATQKLLQVQRGEADPDDRDALAYQRTLGPEDLFADRARKANNEVRKMLWKATLPGSLKRIQPNALGKLIRGTLLDSGLGSTTEEINPLEQYDQRTRVTRMGEGGIPSTDSIPDSARDVHPSHFGFIDAVHTPESSRIGIDGRLTMNTLKGKDGKLYSRFRDARTGNIVWRTPQDLTDAVVSFPGEFMGAVKRGDGLVRAQHRGKLQYVEPQEVDYELASMGEAFGPMASLIPLKPSAFAQRIAMGSRMTTQALPLVNAEAPLVQAGVPGMQDTSYA